MSMQLPDLTDLRLARRDRISTRRLGVLLVLLMGGFCLLTGSMLLTMRQEIWADTARTSLNLLEAETAGIDRILTIYDASLRSAAATLGNPALRDASPELRRLAIFDAVQDTPALGPIRILDEAGAVIYDASTGTPPVATPAEMRALARHRAEAGDAVAISRPFPLAGGAFAVTLSHRVAAAGGGFGGIVVGTIDLDLFQLEFAKLHVGAHDSVSLFSNDGVMLAHIPGAPMVGRSIAGSNLLRQFGDRSSGTFVAPAALDGVRRVFSFRHIAPWPMFVDVGLSTQDLYRPWYLRTLITGFLMVALIGFTIMLLRLLRRDLQARQAAESNLVGSEAKYRLLAESASDVVVRVDRHTIRTYVSPSCAKYGYEPEDLLGMASSSWVHEDDLVEARRLFFRTIDEQVDTLVTYRLRTRSGQYTWVEAHLSPIRQGGYLAVIRDLDGGREHEQAPRGTQAAPEQPALTDELTGLLSRAAYDEKLPASWADAIAGKRPLSLVLLDVDYFRTFGEIEGQDATDAALVAIAELVASGARDAGGLAARYAHNEFAVILPRADQDGAIRVAHHIRATVWNAALEHRGAPSGRLTISVGAATVMPSVVAGSPDALVQAAGDALGRVKQSGRNQVQAVAMA